MLSALKMRILQLGPQARSNTPRQVIDFTLLWAVVLLLAIGLVMVYSASIAMSEASKLTGYRASYYFFRHGIYLLTGLSAAVLIFQIPIVVWQRAAPFLFMAGGFLLVLVLIPRNWKGGQWFATLDSKWASSACSRQS